MNKTLSAIITAGALALGYNKSNAQVWNFDYEREYEARTIYTYKFLPKDTLEGIVLEKRKSRNGIFNLLNNNMLTNPYTITILAREDNGDYILFKEKNNGYAYKSLSEGSSIYIKREHIIEKKHFLAEKKKDAYNSKKNKYKTEKYNELEFEKGKYLGLRNKYIQRNQLLEEKEKILNPKILEEYPSLRRALARIEKRKSKS